MENHGSKIEDKYLHNAEAKMLGIGKRYTIEQCSEVSEDFRRIEELLRPRNYYIVHMYDELSLCKLFGMSIFVEVSGLNEDSEYCNAYIIKDNWPVARRLDIRRDNIENELKLVEVSANLYFLSCYREELEESVESAFRNGRQIEISDFPKSLKGISKEELKELDRIIFFTKMLSEDLDECKEAFERYLYMVENTLQMFEEIKQTRPKCFRDYKGSLDRKCGDLNNKHR